MSAFQLVPGDSHNPVKVIPKSQHILQLIIQFFKLTHTQYLVWDNCVFISPLDQDKLLNVILE